MLREWTDVLLLHLIRHQETIERLAGKLEPRDIAEYTMDGNRGYLWKLSLDYYERSKQVIPQHFLVAGITDKAVQEGMQPEEVDTIGTLIDDIYQVGSSGFNSSHALEYAKRLLEEVRVNRPVQEMMQDGSTVTEIFDKFQAGLSAASVSMITPIDPMKGWEEMIGTVKPEPVGGAEVKYFNILVNGGLMPGEIVVLMGPTGGFKSTIAIDLVCSIAKVERKHTAFFTYEQSFTGGDLSIRLMSRLSGIDRDVLMNTAKDQFSEENKKIMNEAMEFGQYIQVMDRSQASDKVADISACVRDMIAIGKKPKLIVIDQLMNWMQQWPEAASAKDDWFRKTSTKVIKDLKMQICEKYGTSILILHQITAGEISGKKGKTFGATDSAENKAIGFNSDFVLTIGTIAENNVFQMLGAKTRRGPNTSCLVQALPKICRFRFADDYTVSDTGGFEKKGTRNVCIPSEAIDTSKMKGSQAVQ